jgi:hypothetical protein
LDFFVAEPLAFLAALAGRLLFFAADFFALLAAFAAGRFAFLAERAARLAVGCRPARPVVVRRAVRGVS